MQWCNTLHKVTVSILFSHIINDHVWTFRACEIADLQIFKCDFKTTLNPQCKSLSLFSKPRGGRLIWSLKARHIKKNIFYRLFPFNRTLKKVSKARPFWLMTSGIECSFLKDHAWKVCLSVILFLRHHLLV